MNRAEPTPRTLIRNNLYREAMQAASWGFAVSLGLGGIKLAGGIFGDSLALASDAVHSLTDAIISSALMGALIFARKPADREHPYGHARFEAVAGAGVALLLIGLAMGLVRESVTAMGEHRSSPAWFTVGIALVASLFQEILFRYARRVAVQTNSTALLATAWDYRLDAIGGLVVLLGVGVARVGGPAWSWADRAAALFVAATVLWIGIHLLWRNVQDLMDRQADPELVLAIRDSARGVPGVLGTETLRVRKIGLEFLVDIHVEVDADRTVREGHAIAHLVKDRILDDFAAIRDVLVHIEPTPIKASNPSMDPFPVA